MGCDESPAGARLHRVPLNKVLNATGKIDFVELRFVC